MMNNIESTLKTKFWGSSLNHTWTMRLTTVYIHVHVVIQTPPKKKKNLCLILHFSTLRSTVWACMFMFYVLCVYVYVHVCNFALPFNALSLLHAISKECGSGLVKNKSLWYTWHVTHWMWLLAIKNTSKQTINYVSVPRVCSAKFWHFASMYIAIPFYNVHIQLYKREITEKSWWSKPVVILHRFSKQPTFFLITLWQCFQKYTASHCAVGSCDCLNRHMSEHVTVNTSSLVGDLQNRDKAQQSLEGKISSFGVSPFTDYEQHH